MGLIVGNTPGTNLNLDPRKIGAYKKFANKLWNISRFVLENYSGTASPVNENDQKIIDEAQASADKVAEYIENFRFDLASDTAYHFVWDRFASELLEESKQLLVDETARGSRSTALYQSLVIILKTLHPFMPFVTEAIWQELPQKESDLLMVAKWPA
jgi:valyl-tRNA synthetase